MKLKLILLVILILPFLTRAQLDNNKKKFTKADTLRGSLNENRDWWDVLRYDIEVKPDFESKTIIGKNKIIFKGSSDKTLHKRWVASILKKDTLSLQVDLQSPLQIDSIVVDVYVMTGSNHSPKPITYAFLRTEKIRFEQHDNLAIFNWPGDFTEISIDSFTIYYHGKPKEAKNAPWDGGWIWTKDSLGRPWISVAVQGLGASAWYPCKDYQGDEPDNGASLTMIVPDDLMAVSNGKLVQAEILKDSSSYYLDSKQKLKALFKWLVKNPINNYNIVPYIGKYVNWTDTLRGRSDTIYIPGIDPTIFDTVINQRKLDLSFWVLDYNLEKAKQQFQQVKPMLRCFEHWFGAYPFYEDGYKLVDAPHLGMEHQSAVAYGNRYRNGYLGKDRSGTGWGLKWDFIIIHESGHEWFANNITTKDIADMWVHEGFTNYSETLYTEWLFGKQAGDEYNFGTRKNIRNDKPIIGIYGVNEEGSGDMYDKGGNMIHIIRKVINNDEKFRQILRGLNSTFWHQTVTTQQIESYIIKQSGINFQKTFDQYLRTTQIPQLEFYNSKGKIFFRWTNCVDGFNLPLVINNKRYNITTNWNSSKLQNNDLSSWDETQIVKQYYITAKQVTKP